jgi:RHS repeat-associated protein
LDGQTKSVKDAVTNLTEYFYDIAGRLIQEKSALGDRYYQSDLVNNRAQRKDRNGRITKYDYDNLNRVKSETWVGDGQTFTYTYDKNGNRLTAKDGSIEYDYSYDKTDLLERVDRLQAGKPTISFVYDYDNVGNLTKASESLANAIQATTIYTYNSRNLNTKIIQTGPGLANKEVRFTYDPAGLNTIVDRYVDGLLKVKTTNSYDAYGRLTGIKDEKNNAGTFTTIANRIYDLDILSRLNTETETVDDRIRAIDYDNTDQVTTVSGSNSEGYTYDKNGNRINAGYATGAGNRLLSDGTYTYDYDAEGNRTQRTNLLTQAVDLYTWDYRNRLVSIVSKTSITGTVTQTVGYEYDVDDQRVKKTVDGVVENYFIDRNQIAFVTDGGGNETFHYLYGLNVDQVLAQDSSTGMLWALADRLGSIDLLTDKDGVVVDKRSFDSFGRVLSESNPSVSFRYGYTGRERDLESGLSYYRARYYDPNVGRFISIDPLGFEAGDTNLYRYVSNNSTNYTDPTGMWSLEEAWNGAQQTWNNAGQAIVNGSVSFRNTVTSNAQAGLKYWTGVAVAGQNEGGIIGGGKQFVGTGFGLLSSLATEDNVDKTALVLASALGFARVGTFSPGGLSNKLLTNVAKSVGVGVIADLVFPDLLQAPKNKYDNADLPEGYQAQKAAFEIGLGFGIDNGAKLAQGFDKLLTSSGRKLGELLDGVPVLVDGFENFTRNPTSLGELFKPGIQTASAAVNNAGSWFQHFFESRGDQSAMSGSAEIAVSQELGIPRNLQGASAQKVRAVTPSKDNAKVRIPELIFEGKEGSVRKLGAIIEVKASGIPGAAFGKLPDRGRKQILDYVAKADEYRAKASLIKDPVLREQIENTKVIVYTDLQPPTRGQFKKLENQGKLEFRPIPKEAE